MGGRILVAGGSWPSSEDLVNGLAASGFSVVAANGEADPASLESACDAGIATGPEALATCQRLARNPRSFPVVVVDPTPDARRAALALRAGASDYVPYPTSADAVVRALVRVAEQTVFRDRLAQLDQLDVGGDDDLTLVGESPAIRRVTTRLARLESSDATVLITGESGTGKEVIARILHRTGPRRHGPFVAVSCAALPPNLVESELFGHTRGAFTNAGRARPGLLLEATGGSLFLDEVSSMQASTQAKLLRALQQRTVRALGQGTEVSFDARILAASNVDLEEEVARGRFREDLFFRLNVVPIRVPPLRDRGTDSLLLAQLFIRRHARSSGKAVVGMTEQAARAILAHDWPGNVRELENRIEAAVALTRFDRITERELGLHPAARRTASGAPAPELSPWSAIELRHITQVLERAGGNKARAARLLGIDRKTLYRKLRRCGAAAPEDERSLATGTTR